MRLFELVVVTAFVFGCFCNSERQLRPKFKRARNWWYRFANKDKDKDSEEAAFCYDNSLSCGPSKWEGYCIEGNENRQSPVDLSDVDTTEDSSLTNPDYRFSLSSAYNQATFKNFSIQNDGHSIQMNFPETDTYKRLQVSYNISGIPSYQFEGVHFHWGAEREYGAEHKVSSNQEHVLEIHLVHWALKYGSLEEALKATSDPEALSVLGIPVKICRDYLGLISTPFTPILEQLKGVARRPNDKLVEVNKRFSLSQFLPKSKNHFSYQGSLTTPGCLEIVKWTVFQEAICISQREINAFRNILTHQKHELQSNHRPVQPIGNRKISFYGNSS